MYRCVSCQTKIVFKLTLKGFAIKTLPICFLSSLTISIMHFYIHLVLAFIIVISVSLIIALILHYAYDYKYGVLQEGARDYDIAYSRMFGFLVASLLFWAAIGSGLPGFMDPPSLLMIEGVTFGLLLMNFGTAVFRFIPSAFLSFFIKRKYANKEFAEIAKYGYRYSVLSGLLGTIIGLGNLVQNISDKTDIISGVAVAFLTILYGIITAEVIFSFLHKSYLCGEECNEIVNLTIKDIIASFVILFGILIIFSILCFSLY